MYMCFPSITGGGSQGSVIVSQIIVKKVRAGMTTKVCRHYHHPHWPVHRHYWRSHWHLQQLDEIGVLRTLILVVSWRIRSQIITIHSLLQWNHHSHPVIVINVGQDIIVVVVRAIRVRIIISFRVIIKILIVNIVNLFFVPHIVVRLIPTLPVLGSTFMGSRDKMLAMPSWQYQTSPYPSTVPLTFVATFRPV